MIITFAASAQKYDVNDSLRNQTSLKNLNQSPLLFIHFDKTIYAKAEDVWFTAYLLNITNNQQYKTLSIALVNDDNKTIVQEDRFTLKGGFSFGKTAIPHNITTGNYTFVGITNRLINGQPEVVFIQPVSIIPADQQIYSFNSIIVDSSSKHYNEVITHNEQAQLKITVDKNGYRPRQKVNVKIRLSGVLSNGWVSVACVPANTIPNNKANTIENFLNNPEKHDSTGSIDTAGRPGEITFNGFVTKSYIPLKKPVKLFNVGKPENATITDETGKFKIDDAYLITQPDKIVNFMVSEDEPENYQIHLLDPYAEINRKLAIQLKVKNYDESLNKSLLPSTSIRDRHILNTVNIKAECNDYVCQDGYLNCPNHQDDPGNKKPIIGKSYMVDYQGAIAIYNGCTGVRKSVPKYNRSVLQVKGIYEPQKFHAPDYSQADSSNPEYVSTIYWKHQLKISAVKDTEISFYTSDITGRYKIIVQGITDKDVIYGEKTFNVIKPK